MYYEPGSLMLVPTLKCSQQCYHCCRASAPWRRERMTRETAAQVSHFWPCVDGDVRCMTISGGEPLLMSQELWDITLAALPYDLSIIGIVSNGDFLKSRAMTERVITYVLPKLAEHIDTDLGYPEEALSITLSGNDGYHNTFDLAAWTKFRLRVDAALEVGWDDYVEHPVDEDGEADLSDWAAKLNGVKVGLSARRGGAGPIQPLGRAAKWAGGSKRDHVDCGVNIEQVEAYDDDDDGLMAKVDITVYPDGSLRACCGGGPVIGHVREDFNTVAARHVAFVQALRERYGAKPDYGNEKVVGSDTCLKCFKVAREFYDPRTQNGKE